MIDRDISIVAATTGLRTVALGLNRFGLSRLPLKVGAEERLIGKVAGMGYRYMRLVLIDAPVAMLHGIVRHEVGGHGGRLRELGVDFDGYRIGLPPPYGRGGGQTRVDLARLTSTDVAVVAAGGLEAGWIDLNALETRWIVKGRMGLFEALMYNEAVLEISSYVAAPPLFEFGPGHDIGRYIQAINDRAQDQPSGEPLRHKQLQRAVIVEALNPAQWYTFYAIFWRYLVRGQTSTGIPAVSLSEFDLMPAVHLRLTPFGYAVAMRLHGKRGERALTAGVDLGTGPWGRFGSLELRSASLFSVSDVAIGGHAAAWRQYGLESPTRGRRLGGMAIMRAALALAQPDASVFLQVGWKTQGYSLGHSPYAGPIGRAGLVVRW